MNIEKQTFRILLVEDEPLDARLVTRALKPSGTEAVEGYHFEVDRVPTLTDAIDRISQEDFDLVLLDLGLPDSIGTEAVDRVNEAKPNLPIVVLTGNDDTATALDAVQKGAQDYFIKQTLAQHALVRCLLYAIERQSLNDQLKHQIKKLEHYADELKASNIELQQFAYVASHDLQTPLRAIAGFLQMLQNDYQGKISKEADGWINRSVAAANQLHLLINDLLVYSRTHSQGQAFKPVDLNESVQEAISLLESTIDENQGEVTFDSLPTVLADASQMLQLFQNLIGNAIKYRREDPPRVHIGAKDQGTHWTLSVTDNGIGIDEQYFDQIFEIFRRLHGTGKYPGSGIGLAICKKIIHRHGGKIWINSQSGRGSTFFVDLPAVTQMETTSDFATQTQTSADLVSGG